MKILFLQKRILFPPNIGGKIRTLNVLRHLAEWHDVTYLCNLQPGEEDGAQKMRNLGVRLETVPWNETPRSSPWFYKDLAVNLLSRYPFNVNKDYDPRLRRRAEELLASEPFDLVICDFVQMARNAIGLAAPAKILFEHNVEAQIFRRHSEQDEGRLRRLYMRLQWKKMARFEAEAGRAFDAVVAVSRQDRETYEREYGWRHVEVIDTAVDTNYFQPQPGDDRSDASGGGRVAFVGSMDWLPNIDGVTHSVRHIWPEIRRRHPQAEFHVIGRDPTPAVRKLEETPGVKVVGSVPDVRPHVSAADVVVVPLLVGGGTRLKIFEAMAMQKAIVSTPLGAEGLDVVSGEHLMLAEEPPAFAEAVTRLLDDPQHRNRLAGNARQLVVENYSAETVARQFEAICLRTCEKAGENQPDPSSVPGNAVMA